MRKTSATLILLLLFQLVLGCDAKQEPASPETAAPQPAAGKATIVPSSGGAAVASSVVSRVVFVGQKDACPCTRERIAKTWPNVEKAVAGFKGVSIQKIQNDVEIEEADRYDNMRSVMVIPGIYFMDRNEKLIEMLQGEVTEAQITAVLQK